MRFGGVVDASSANGGTDGAGATARTKRSVLRKVLLVGVCVAALGLVPAAAVATPGSGVSGTVVAKGTSQGKLKVKPPGAVRTSPSGRSPWSPADQPAGTPTGAS